MFASGRLGFLAIISHLQVCSTELPYVPLALLLATGTSKLVGKQLLPMIMVTSSTCYQEQLSRLTHAYPMSFSKEKMKNSYMHME